MAVEKNVDRIAVELTYDTSLVEGETINVKATNVADDDVSTRDDLANDGRFTWTYPADYKGEAEFYVTGSDGGEDSGIVQLG